MIRIDGENEAVGQDAVQPCDLKMEPLTPQNAADIGVYAKALDQLFDMPEVRNVALTGPFGAGKSTVFRSYFSKGRANSVSEMPEVKTISLAHFHGLGDNISNDCPDGREWSTKHLEGEIIGQLVLTLDPKNIAHSRFHRPVQVDGPSMAFRVGLFVLLLFLVGIFTHVIPVPRYWDAMVDRGWMDFAAAVAATFIGGVFLYWLLLEQRKLGFIKRVSAKSYSFEVFDEKEDSFFDRHLGEVLYLFENAGCFNFAFEDLDRYGNVQIFEQLRKVNDLLNARNKEETPYRFFYLVRDGLFESRERTKFFDLIIPIIPYVDNKNSLDLLSRRLDSCGRTIEKSVLALISFFVDDMRTLQNICNEYLVYTERIGGSTYLNQEKLLSFVLYKNLYPRDYDLLCQGAGTLNVLFDRNIKEIASIAINERKRSVQSEIERLRESLENGGADDLTFSNNCVEERRSELSWLEICDPEEYLQGTSIRGMIGESLEVSDKVGQLIAESLYLSGDISISLLDQCFQGEALSDVPGCTDDDLRRRAAEEVKFSCRALYSLIENGLIDENYHDYVSYFHEGYLSKDDKRFIRYVIDGKVSSFDLPLKNPDEVIAELTEADFGKTAALNYRLMERVLDTHNETAFRCMAKRVSADARFDFVSGFFNWLVSQSFDEVDGVRSTDRAIGLTARLAVRANIESDNGLIKKAIVGDGVAGDVALDFVCYLLWGSEPNSFDAFPHREALQRMLDEKPVLAQRLTAEPNWLVNALDCLLAAKIVFSNMAIFKAGQPAVEAVVEKGLFAFNVHNIEFLMDEFYSAGTNWTRYLSVLHQKSDTILSQRIEANLNEFVNLMICQADVIYCDADTVLPYLHSSIVHEELKRKLIGKLRGASFDLQAVNNQGVELLLLERGLVRRSADNLVRLISQSDGVLSDQVKRFVNEADRFNFNVVEFHGDQEVREAINSILLSEGVNQRVLRSILFTAKCQCRDFDLIGVAEENMGILIESPYLAMNVHNLNFIRRNYPEFTSYFIGTNPQEYAICLSEGCSPIGGELEQLLSWSGVTEEEKIDCLDCTGAVISLQDVTVSDRVFRKILKEHFDWNDLPWLIKTYSDREDTIKGAIADIVEEALVEGKVGEIQKYPVDLLVELSGRDIGSEGIFKAVLARSIKNIELSDFKSIVGASSDEDLRSVGLSLGSGKRPRVKKSQEMVEFLEVVAHCGWIASFTILDRSIRVNGRRRILEEPGSSVLQVE